MNLTNILAAAMSFMAALALIWLSWQFVSVVTALLPSALSIAINLMFATLIITTMIVMPIMFLVADKDGKV